MHNQTVVVLSALEGNERQIFRPFLTNEQVIRHPATQTDYYSGTLQTETGDVRLILGRTDQTNVSAALETDRALAHFTPRYAFFVGVAGGLKDVEVGDIVIGKDVYGYERGKTTADGFRARPGAGNSSYALERAATGFVHSQPWQDIARDLPNGNFPSPVNIVTGTIASGEKVDGAVTSELHRFLQEHCNHALAVEMEGFGFLEAARQHPQVHALIVRGISDLVDDKSKSDGLGSQPYASANAAAFTIALIKQLYSTTYTKRLPTPEEAKQLIAIASELYSGGIRDAAIWERAGGRVSDIAVSPNGRTQWQDAMRHMRNGGRGASFSKLLDEMLEDFPDKVELLSIRG
ncbi:5'-methylthioadenosine/S-adenosylhomocysteine nucleosidase [Hymenobacter edaphi]|uniref:Phosphorylase n=1 Tax=Hymenobacter edaphi TaxID=2211146 RepID=A0A328BTD1_9BACT|nr:5'-methylthioadenosine/S-adenosylhomocysteine nucleosidase [Hymenobacter edaphi]RAK70323.1 phosphorylase [Hymenobacter edaphi]